MSGTKNDTTVNERILTSPPVIAPVPADTVRPLWSVMIPVYNCRQYLTSTIEAVLIQDPGEAIMQIEVVDDCSTDADVEALVQHLGGGRIGYYRQPSNVGSLRNFKTCLERSRGHLVHLLHGDDCVKPGFYSRLQKLFEKESSVGAAFCRFEYIDGNGRLLYPQNPEMLHEGVLTTNWIEQLCERQRIQYVSMVVRRSVYEKMGGFYGAEYGEDWEMWVRIAANYPIGYIPDVLASYRMHRSSISGKSFLTGRNMVELQTVMDKVHQYVPEKTRSAIAGKSRKFYSHYALRVANSLWIDLRHRAGAIAQVKAAWQMNKDVSLGYKILKLFTRMTLNV